MAVHECRAVRLCLDYVLRVKRVLSTQLYCHHLFEQQMGRILRVKSPDNIQYGFDVLGHRLLLDLLAEKKIDAQVFSEEGDGSWISVGSGRDYTIIVDPFDQSSSAMRTFRLASVAICVADGAYHFQACAIGDLSTEMIYFADAQQAYLAYATLDAQTPIEAMPFVPIHTSSTSAADDAYVVCPASKRSRRQYACDSSLLRKVDKWLNVDGVLNLGRLAGGYIDAFLDPWVGQPIYEIVCAELVKKAGGIVTDAQGSAFCITKQLGLLHMNPEQRYKIVASCGEPLHGELLKLVRDDLRRLEDTANSGGN